MIFSITIHKPNDVQSPSISTLSRIGQASGQIRMDCFVKQSYQRISVVSLGYC